MVRLKDIAQRAGVSIMTVSKALRDEPDVSAATKAKVKLLAQQLGYVPDSSAQGLRTRTTRLLGLAIPSLSHPVSARILLALEERAHELGYDLLVAQTLNVPEREEICLRRFMARRVDGLFITPVYRMGTEARVYQEIAARKIPTVILGHPAPFCSQFVNVEADDLLGGYLVTEHLLKLGHKRIAFFAGPLAIPADRERFEGYRRALREHNLDVDEKLVFEAGRSIEGGAAAALQMITEGAEVTAIQAVNDLVAIGCSETLIRQGLVIPKHLSITGFGNFLPGEYYKVPLTTVSQPKFRLGEAAVDSMQQLLQGRRPESRRLPLDLIPRQSSGIAPATYPIRHLKTATSENSV